MALQILTTEHFLYSVKNFHWKNYELSTHDGRWY